MLNTFKAGIHPGGMKGLSGGAAISEGTVPKKVYIPLVQHLGKPAVPVVTAGERVTAGQLIARADGDISAAIFASVSGTVTGIAERVTASGYCGHIVIENDFSGGEFRFDPLTNPSAEEIRQRVKDCGIVGMGGAGFPSAVKLAGKGADTFIINGAECEPYITCDYRIMIELTEQFLTGAVLLAKAAGVSVVHIAVEDNKGDAIAHLEDFLSKNPQINAKIVPVKTKYPQGAEKQLIYAVTKRKVPVGKLPIVCGVLVNNVHTALSTYYAVCEGQTLYKRIMTVSGGGVTTPKNMWALNGTLYKDLIEYCGGFKEGTSTVKLISGGPMMGIAVESGEIATTKTTSCLLALTKDEAFTGEPNPCINCGKCARVCPMKLMPMYIDMYSLAGDNNNAVKYGARNCIECGCCAYICPAKRPLVQSIKLAKKKAQTRGGN